jgi:uncharacterized phage protein gp47/JayE
VSAFPSYDDLFRTGRDEILAKNSRLRRDVVEREGTDVNAIVAASAGVGDELVLHLVRMCAGQFLDSARGQYLRRLVFDRYGISAKSASPSFGTVQFSTSAATAVQFGIPTGTKVQTNDGRQFLTTSDATFPANSTGPVLVAVRSAQAGLSQQAKAGVITTLVSTLSGAPATLAVTNTLATSGGADEESDDDLRARGKAFFSTARVGTLSAIKEAALAVGGVKRASIFEGLDALGRPAMRAQLVVTDAFTEALVTAAVTPPTYATQSQVLADAVYEALVDVRAAGAYIDVIVAQVILQSAQLALSFDTSANVDTVALKARTAVVLYINSLSPGEALTPEGIVETLRLVQGLIVTGAEVVSPSGSVTPERLQVLRTMLSMVTTISTNPNRALQSSMNPDAV